MGLPRCQPRTPCLQPDLPLSSLRDKADSYCSPSRPSSHTYFVLTWLCPECVGFLLVQSSPASSPLHFSSIPLPNLYSRPRRGPALPGGVLGLLLLSPTRLGRWTCRHVSVVPASHRASSGAGAHTVLRPVWRKGTATHQGAGRAQYEPPPSPHQLHGSGRVRGNLSSWKHCRRLTG